MKRQHRRLQTPHACLRERPLRFADVIDEVSQLAASPGEAAEVIADMLRRRTIRFTDDFDSRLLTI
jgi:hypothetical protein